MSRRKQARPSRLLDEEEEDEKGGVNNHITSDKQAEKEDANNNESKEKDSEDDEEEELIKGENENTGIVIQNMLSNLQWPAVSPSVTLEALQNTKVAVAQLAASALANNNGENAQDLAVLQSTLFTLQQQQLLQLQLIQQLQQQLHVSNSNSDEDDSNSPPPGLPPIKLPQQSGEQPEDFVKGKEEVDEDEITEEDEKEGRTKAGRQQQQQQQQQQHSDGCGLNSLSPAFASLLNCPNQDPNRPLSPGLQSHQINNNHLTQTDVPNTLDILQKRAEEVLDSASQGLLASSLAADDPRKKLGPYEKGREPFFKHRCRYCGKVFGSDSALQIHIRSHTGERPFKCNVCGSRFTTKGNLKVHFQRHTSKFPHVKMNPHPIPEHLDHFHPPLLQNNSSNPTTPEHSPNPQPTPPQLPQQLPPPPPFMHHHGAPFFSPLFRFDVKPPSHHHPFFSNNHSHKEAPLSPQDLTKPKNVKKEREEVAVEEEAEDEEEDEEELLHSSPKLVDEAREDEPSEEMKTSDKEFEGDRDEDEAENEEEEQPENLSSKSLPLMYPLPLVARPDRPSSSSASTPTTLTNRSDASPNPIRFHLHPHAQHPGAKLIFDPAKDPAIYTNLLPRPGSNDNAWESLIEVTKTSETSKLQQLVDNIEHKLTDPNQCIICHRVLSCKSALQMHYRTHTGERPFKCKICGRAFTTKGNLKTHMGVHRAKPPLRVLHQCPVCHKRFTNSLVLQQHIRLHTGEPTDLTIDQIRAAEVKDGYPPYGNPLFGTFSTMSEEEMMMNEESTTSETNESVESEIKPTTSLAALENQVRTITTTAASNFSAVNLSSPKMNNTHNNDSGSSAGGSPLPQQMSSSQNSVGQLPTTSSAGIALDLTPPRGSGPQIFNPFHHLPPPHFTSSLLTPTTSSAVAALANLSSSFSPVLVPPPRLAENEAFLWSAAAAAQQRSTTCQLCLKTFACNSALEIHMRSHTKERPFKCNICERGFSTKGNMKQHMLTHKIRDIHPASSNSSFDSNRQNGLCGQSDDSSGKSPPASPPPPILPNNNKRPASPASPPQPIKRPNEGLPSSSSSSSDKHVCKVCMKNFSSSSALSIHCRVHSGERPFKCEVCQKAFTTKGNLKVHMGTHNMWNGVSRRGRRMSLDPLSVFLPHHPPLNQILGGTTRTTIRSDLHHLPHHRPTELFFPFNNNAQQNTFQLNGSLKSPQSPQSPTEREDDEKSNHEDDGGDNADSSKENGEEDEALETQHCIKKKEQEA